ncbi:uncharacterized protein CLUP02_09516 [Colletotrichum lupini]|uniref:Uncharacterized protein n=1 Tax=Colletotrichum lupini TaxID=145971 RepID=A0A9Q8WIN6_9PEZI|nr:uncharacterized protein CLUP02_09516 [Colletotrichum lupini]UQC84020.1 hypothetical protein CLUP02_09516 [Colletotrichum lupini]
MAPLVIVGTCKKASPRLHVDNCIAGRFQLSASLELVETLVYFAFCVVQDDLTNMTGHRRDWTRIPSIKTPWKTDVLARPMTARVPKPENWAQLHFLKERERMAAVRYCPSSVEPTEGRRPSQVVQLLCFGSAGTGRWRNNSKQSVAVCRADGAAYLRRCAADLMGVIVMMSSCQRVDDRLPSLYTFYLTLKAHLTATNFITLRQYARHDARRGLAAKNANIGILHCQTLLSNHRAVQLPTPPFSHFLPSTRTEDNSGLVLPIQGGRIPWPPPRLSRVIDAPTGERLALKRKERARSAKSRTQLVATSSQTPSRSALPLAFQRLHSVIDGYRNPSRYRPTVASCRTLQIARVMWQSSPLTYFARMKLFPPSPNDHTEKPPTCLEEEGTVSALIEEGKILDDHQKRNRRFAQSRIAMSFESVANTSRGVFPSIHWSSVDYRYNSPISPIVEQPDLRTFRCYGPSSRPSSMGTGSTRMSGLTGHRTESSHANQWSPRSSGTMRHKGLYLNIPSSFPVNSHAMAAELSLILDTYPEVDIDSDLGYRKVCPSDVMKSQEHKSALGLNSRVGLLFHNVGSGRHKMRGRSGAGHGSHGLNRLTPASPHIAVGIS